MKIYNFTKSMNKNNLKQFQLRYAETKKNLAKASGSEDMVEISTEAMEKYTLKLQDDSRYLDKKDNLVKYSSVLELIFENNNRNLDEVKNKIDDDYFSNNENLRITSDKILEFLM